jgi:mycothiol synthase
MTVEQMREIERQGVAEGTTRWVIFARSEETGRFVGLSEVFWNPAAPQTVQQGDTGVHPDHRGHALGKWMKAEMLERIMTRWPDAVDVRTGNADSNDAMLGINHALGFRPYIASTNWQVSVETVARYLTT